MKRQLFSDRYSDVIFIPINNEVRRCVSDIFTYFYKETEVIVNKQTQLKELVTTERQVYIDLSKKHGLFDRIEKVKTVDGEVLEIHQWRKPEISYEKLLMMDEYLFFDTIELWDYYAQDPEFSIKINTLFRESTLPYRLINGEITMTNETENQFTNLKDFLENTPPYQEVKISYDMLRELSILHGKTIKVDAFCDCGADNRTKRTFVSDKIDITLIHNWAMDKSPTGYFLPNEAGKAACEQRQKEKYDNGIKTVPKNYYVPLPFTCTSCDTKQLFYYLRFNEFTITKIGQYPSFSGQEIKEFAKYKNIISKYYIEIKDSLKAHSQKMNIGAFVYLRRIIEHLVDEKCQIYGVPFEEQNEKGEMKRRKFVDKLTELENEKNVKIIPQAFEGQKNQIYTVLSKGVHEYSENECKELYPFVLHVIKQVLDKIYLEKEQERMDLEAAQIIAKKAGKN